MSVCVPVAWVNVIVPVLGVNVAPPLDQFPETVKAAVEGALLRSHW